MPSESEKELLKQINALPQKKRKGCTFTFSSTETTLYLKDKNGQFIDYFFACDLANILERLHNGENIRNIRIPYTPKETP